MFKAIGAVLMSVMLIVFLSGCGQSEQPAKQAQPSKTEQPKPEQMKPEQPKAEHPQSEHPKSEHPK